MNKILVVDILLQKDINAEQILVYLLDGNPAPDEYTRAVAPNMDENPKEYIAILAMALSVVIRKLEADGTYPPGKAMRKAYDILEHMYVSNALYTTTVKKKEDE